MFRIEERSEASQWGESMCRPRLYNDGAQGDLRRDGECLRQGGGRPTPNAPINGGRKKTAGFPRGSQIRGLLMNGWCVENIKKLLMNEGRYFSINLRRGSTGDGRCLPCLAGAWSSSSHRRISPRTPTISLASCWAASPSGLRMAVGAPWGPETEIRKKVPCKRRPGRAPVFSGRSGHGPRRDE